MSEGPRAIVEQVGPSTGRASVRDHTLLVDRPEAKGGADQGPMGGELILAGLAGCFLSNLLAAARTREADVSDVRIVAQATVTGTPPRMSAFALRVSASYEDEGMMLRLLEIAERGCIASNTLREGSEISVTLEDRATADS